MISLFQDIYIDIIKYWQVCHRPALLAGLIMMLLGSAYTIFMIRKQKSEKWKGTKFLWCNILWFLTGIYVVYFFYITFGIRYVGQRQELDLIPFHNISRNSQELRFVVENILLFIPFGCLLPIGIKRCRRFTRVTSCAAALSICIEILQYVFRCGKTEVNDVIMNLAGTILGYLLFGIFLGAIILSRRIHYFRNK